MWSWEGSSQSSGGTGVSPVGGSDELAKNGLPAVVGTEAWDRRILNTQLASWAQLRHNTVLYAKQSFIERYPNTMQALTNAFYKTLQWLKTASPEDIAATVPEEFLLGDRDLYVLAAGKSKPSYSLTGIIDPSGMRSTYDMLRQFDDELKDSDVDLSTTFDDRFARKAPDLVK